MAHYFHVFADDSILNTPPPLQNELQPLRPVFQYLPRQYPAESGIVYTLL